MPPAAGSNSPGEAPSAGSPLHGTAIVVGAIGLLFTGPSGSGKTMTALQCLWRAQSRGWHAGLIADDRVELVHASGVVIMRAPPPIAGLVEIRGSGVVAARRQEQAVLRLVVAPGVPSGIDRVPPEGETMAVNGAKLPLVRLLYGAVGDPLSTLLYLRPQLFGYG